MTYPQLFDKLRDKPMHERHFHTCIKNIGGLYADIESELELLKGAGAPLCVQTHNGDTYFSLWTMFAKWQDSDLVFVDIETNGAKPQSAEIIEIGALKVRNGEMIESYESFIYADYIPENITELTGITQDDIANAPSKYEVLEQFRQFLGNNIFIAHNVHFDYTFLDYHLRRCGMFGLLNPKLCTLELARRTILAKRYALSYLNEFLGIHTPISHRAYADALTAFRIFHIAQLMFPESVHSVQELIDFSKGRLKLPHTCI